MKSPHHLMLWTADILCALCFPAHPFNWKGHCGLFVQVCMVWLNTSEDTQRCIFLSMYSHWFYYYLTSTWTVFTHYLPCLTQHCDIMIAVILSTSSSVFNFISSKTKTWFTFFLPSLLFFVFPCHAPLPTHTHCPKSSEGHPGAQWVAVMSSNEPIDNLSTDWLVLQALTMCFTEHFLARAASSLLDMSPAMPSIWA